MWGGRLEFDTGYFDGSLLLHFLREDLSLNLELIDLARVVGQ